jgi:hypothetical protein
MRFVVLIFTMCSLFPTRCFSQEQLQQPNQQTADATQPPAVTKPGLPELDSDKVTVKPAPPKELDRGEIPPADPIGTANMDELAKMIFSRRTGLPSSPDAKAEVLEAMGCPGGAASPCALLGGRSFYPDA